VSCCSATPDAAICPRQRQCIQNCTECHSVCLETDTHYLALGGKQAAPGHIGLLLDCAEICLTSADFMLRASESHPETCRVCADVCERCADGCERLAEGNAMMSAALQSAAAAPNRACAWRERRRASSVSSSCDLCGTRCWRLPRAGPAEGRQRSRKHDLFQPPGQFEWA
jgi:hypothetical protein